MNNAKRRADRIREEIPIVRVLAAYGYEVDSAGEDREQQFSCDLHGDGRDSKPSARVYPLSSSFYCFACGRTRDIITLVREKEGVEFGRACSLLEQRYGLPALPWEDDVEEGGEVGDRPGDAAKRKLNSDPTRTFAQERDRVEAGLNNETNWRERPLDQLLGFWEAFDRICHGVGRESWGEEKGKDAMLALLSKIKGPSSETA